MFWQLLLIATGIWTLFYRLQRRKIYRLEKEIASCNLFKLPLLGHAYLFFGSNEDHMDTFKTLSSISIKNGGLTTVWMVNKLYIVVTDPVAAKVILKNCLDKDNTSIKYLQTLFENGSTFAPVNIWRPRRKILAPLFNVKNLNAFFMVFAAQSRIMTKQLEFEAGNGNFSFWKYISTYTFDSVCQTSLGIELNSQKQPDHPFLAAFDIISELLVERGSQPWLYSDKVYKMLPRYKTFLKYKKQLFEFVDELVKLKRKELAATRLTNNGKNTDSERMRTFLEMLIESSGGADGYTDLELYEEVLVIILAGTDTTAVGTAFTTLMLSRYPDVQKKVYQELKEVFGDSDRPITIKDLQNLKYLESVIKETLRTYTAVPVVLREVHNHVKLSSGATLVDGVGILLNFWAMHRNPKYWGEDAELFRPERFLDGPLKHPGQFMPFSFSLRNCLGSSYAMMSMKIVLSTLLRRYRILPPSGLDPQQWTAPLRVKFTAMMKDVDDYIIRLEHRN